MTRYFMLDTPLRQMEQHILRADIHYPEQMKMLNELADSIGQMDDREWNIFAGALDAESINGLDDVLNLSKRLGNFTVGSHPAVLDGFVNLFRKAQEELHMFDRSQCDSLNGQELEGSVLVMSPYTLKESYWSPENQLWLATGGFGCNPSAAGRAVYATCLGDGEQTRWDRSDFIGILKEEHLPDWARESLEQLRQDAPAESPDLNTQSM